MAVSILWWSLLVMLATGRQVQALWWPFSSGESETEKPAPVAAPREPVSFEVESAEQKFLAEAAELLNISPLEACQHQVVRELRRSCGEMGEEDLGKMAVALLNCQSQAENRQTFPCTADMSLAECTSGMDPTVWNAYHIISNRARSVCYATRQQLFRRQTEAVVNRLSSSSLQQIQAMSDLSEQQAEVRQLALSSLETLQEAQREAEKREREIAASQQGVKEKIAANLEHLAQEKVLISSGQQLLANMTSDIRKQLEVASDMLGSQEQNMKESQREILEDISTVRENIHGVWGRIDNRTAELLGVLQDITDHYQDTLESLRVINETLAGVQEMVQGMSSAVHSQLDWVVGQLGGANYGLRVLTSCAAHTLFLLVAMLISVFIRAPAPARLFLLVATVTNTVLDIRIGTALTISALATMATIVVLFNWLLNTLCSRGSHSTSSLPPQPLASHAHSQPCHTHQQSLDCSGECEGSVMMGEYEVEAKPVRAARDLTPQFLAAETLSSTPTKNSSVSARCVAMTASGMQCRLRPIPGDVTCHRHN